MTIAKQVKSSLEDIPLGDREEEYPQVEYEVSLRVPVEEVGDFAFRYGSKIEKIEKVKPEKERRGTEEELKALRGKLAFSTSRTFFVPHLPHFQIGEKTTVVEKQIIINREDLEVWEKEKNAFAMMKKFLLSEENYKGKFVAVYGGKIVDHDADDRELAKRVYEKYGYHPIYFGRVTEEIKIIEVPSPEYG